jgi:hypothetical protein
MSAASLALPFLGMGYHRRNQDTQAADLVSERKTLMEVQKTDDDRHITFVDLKSLIASKISRTASRSSFGALI